MNYPAEVSPIHRVMSVCKMLKRSTLRPLLGLLILCAASRLSAADGITSGSDMGLQYTKVIQPILEQHCYDCHGYGATEGNLALDRFASPDEAVSAADLWLQVMKNLRAGVMPPADSSRLSEEELESISQWVKLGPFGIDPNAIDPGPIMFRRLNRVEYGNTVRELMGVDFDETLLFPPDDSGHGFDNVADALMVSPLLLDKYLQAAEMVVARAVPQVTWIVPRQDFDGAEFKSAGKGEDRKNGRRLDGKEPAELSRQIEIDAEGKYSVQIRVKQHGSFEFDPARYTVTCSIDGEERFNVELGWDENKRTDFEYKEDWSAGKHEIAFRLDPVVPEQNAGEELLDEGGTSVSFQIDSVSVEGPLGTDRRVHPKNYERFFIRDEPPTDEAERREYAREVLQRFAHRAFRGHAAPETVDRLVAIAESTYSQAETTFEAGIARAMVAALVSPKFLFRVESTEPSDGPIAQVDEYSLASRLSYFLWSSMPDETLLNLARDGKLREQLGEQIDRMLSDPKAEAFATNFVGQWLRTRDVVSISVDAAVVLGVSEEYEELREWLRGRFRRGRGRGEMSDEDQAKFARMREIREVVERVDANLKRAMQRETEMFVEHIARSDASLLDILDSNYTFLNEQLAEHYGIAGVEGREMRKVELPEDSPRGGVLTHASMLLVTSNPTRTSPVKRGLFVLENILGTPAPPAPAVVPELEASSDRFKDHEPTLRELLEVHRESALCASCHARMDPIGFALENFDALGMWRDKDGDAVIEPHGQLVTGEEFEDIRGLKKLLRENHAQDFYRCISEKLLIFAIGRGIEYTDEQTVDEIVERLDASGGSFRALVRAVIESAPFQKQRVPESSPVMTAVGTK